jgi:DNA-binding protein H-NS
VYDLEALSLGELKKMQKDVAKAISTYRDRQKVEARAKVEPLARDLGYSLAELFGIDTTPPEHRSRRNSGTLRTQH